MTHSFPPRRASDLVAIHTSARNQFSGKIARLTRGAVNDEVELVLSGGEVLTATVTHTSSETLGLRKGAEAIALIKASAIIIAVDDGVPLKLRSEEHTSELQSLMRISYAVFCLKKKKTQKKKLQYILEVTNNITTT